jgi:hypothetical protein
VISVAPGGRGFAALGVQALDGSGTRKDAIAFVADDMNEEPRNGIGIGRGSVRNSFAIDAAGVASQPRGSFEMLAEEIAVGVEEVGVWSFQSPGELGAVGLASVDLIAFGVEGEEELFAGGRLELRGNLLGGGGRGREQWGAGEECDGSEGADLAVHEVGPPVATRMLVTEKNITQAGMLGSRDFCVALVARSERDSSRCSE